MSRVGYVAGAFRAPNQWEQWRNIWRAIEVGHEVWKLGAAAIVPHANTFPFQGSLPDETWLGGDLDILGRCDFVMLVPGWEHSVGTRGEIEFARQHNIPVFDNLGKLYDWIRGIVPDDQRQIGLFGTDLGDNLLTSPTKEDKK